MLSNIRRPIADDVNSSRRHIGLSSKVYIPDDQAYTAGGVPVQTRTRLAQGDSLLTYTNDITVDRHGRPVTSVLTRGDSGPSWTLAANTYDGIGRLSSVTAGGTLTRNVSYDIHGWMTGWETPFIIQTLLYGESGQPNTAPSYTGLITGRVTQIGGLSGTYRYSYDRLGRLTAAAYTGRKVGEDFSTTYSYDLQGNMLRMTRKGLTAPGQHGLIDDVTATYTGNQLHTLRDDAPEVLLEASMDVAAGTYSSDAFDYDANGNLTRDMSRDITNMEYNALNLPCRATFADGSHINWLYTASGQKLRQTVIAATGDTIARRDYLGPYLFTDKQFDRYLTSEGYITADGVYHAYIPDYQGNIVGVVNTAERAWEQYTEYYPYGLPFATSSTPDANRRKYGAKELTPDLGLNAYDFEARTLVPAFPMFIQQDPMAEKYYPLSPYLYCAGTPINAIDPDSQEVILKGANINIFVSQLQLKAGKAITLSLNTDGSLIYERSIPNEKLKGEAKRIAGIIDDSDIRVNMDCVSGDKTSSGDLLIGGAFMGNKVKVNNDNRITVEADQTVNPTVLKKMGEAHGKPGANEYHELTEAYEGAKASRKQKKSSPRAGLPGSVYQEAHKKASPQSGTIYQRFYDDNGKEIQNTNGKIPSNATSVEWQVNDKKGNSVVIQKYP